MQTFVENVFFRFLQELVVKFEAIFSESSVQFYRISYSSGLQTGPDNRVKQKAAEQKSFFEFFVYNSG